MAPIGTLYGASESYSNKVLITAKYNGLELSFKETPPTETQTKEFLAKWPLGKTPVFEDSEGFYLSDSDAIAYYVANYKEGTSLLGGTKKAEALIHSFVKMAANEVGPVAFAWIWPIAGYAKYDKDATAQAKENCKRFLTFLNNHLASRTFLVGDRVTLADITMVSAFSHFYKMVFDAAFIGPFKNVTRWFTTCVNQPHFKSVLGTFEFCKEAQVYDAKTAAAAAAKKEKAPSAKKEEKPAKAAKKEEKPAGEDLEAIAAAEMAKPKEKNPLDLLPKSSLVLDDWKRFYSNNDTRPTAVNWFWQHFDPQGYSIWKCDYKYNDELTQIFMSSNLIGGFFQRLESARKYAFGSMLVLGTASKSKITGYFVFRGLDIPFEVKDSADYESYQFTKVDHTKPAVREHVNAVFAWDEKIDGMVCADGKTFK